MNTNSIHPTTQPSKGRRPLKKLALAALTLVVLGLALTGPTSALPCDGPNASPNVTLTLGVATHKVTSTSPDAGYATQGCEYWVVDISVPNDSSGLGDDFKSFKIFTNSVFPSNPTACVGFWERTYVYKYSQVKYKQIGYWEKKGSWNGSYCSLKNVSSPIPLPPLTPPSAGSDRYRVASQRKDTNSGKWTAVLVTAFHEEPLK